MAHITRTSHARSDRCRTLVHERPRPRPFHVADFHRIDFEPGAADQFVHLAIKMTASADQLPVRRQLMLPASGSDLLGVACGKEADRTPGAEENRFSIGTT